MYFYLDLYISFMFYIILLYFKFFILQTGLLFLILLYNLLTLYLLFEIIFIIYLYNFHYLIVGIAAVRHDFQSGKTSLNMWEEEIVILFWNNFVIKDRAKEPMRCQPFLHYLFLNYLLIIYFNFKCFFILSFSSITGYGKVKSIYEKSMNGKSIYLQNNRFNHFENAVFWYTFDFVQYPNFFYFLKYFFPLSANTWFVTKLCNFKYS